jgi:hypothetical protein
MKIIFRSALILIVLMAFVGCRGKGGASAGTGAAEEMTSASDTGFTGLKKFKSGGHVVMEAEFKNGIKEGITKTFYESGMVRGITIYRNGLRQDSAQWFFAQGELFRTTPYKNDTVDGIQRQYYRNGSLKARIGYRKGLRTFEFDEFDMSGRKYTGYPELLVSTKDDYKSSGTFTISLSTSDKEAKVRYYRGDFGNGLFDSAHCEKIKIINGAGVLELKKTQTPQAESVDVLAAILSPYGNSYLTWKKVALPYKDLK